MKIYILLLRGVNVSGTNQIIMTDLRKELEQMGFEKVVTYIQSGNIVLQSSWAAEEVKKKVQNVLIDQFGVNSMVWVVTRTYLQQIIKETALSENRDPSKLFITFSDQAIDSDFTIDLVKWKKEEEYIYIGHDWLHYYLPNGMSKSKITNQLIERVYKVNATTRNYRTLQKLLEMATS